MRPNSVGSGAGLVKERGRRVCKPADILFESGRPPFKTPSRNSEHGEPL